MTVYFEKCCTVQGGASNKGVSGKHDDTLVFAAAIFTSLPSQPLNFLMLQVSFVYEPIKKEATGKVRLKAKLLRTFKYARKKKQK